MDELFGIDLDEQGAPLLRGLKGGSGGGGRGGGSSGGGSKGGGGGIWGGGRGNTNNNGGGGGNGGPSIWVYILASIGGLIFLLTCCFCCAKKRKRNESDSAASADSNADFHEAVTSANNRVKYAMSNISVNDASANFETYTGRFNVRYKDRGSDLSGSTTIQLKHNGVDGYTIDGDASDADGIAKITHGFATVAGDAWWVEETFSGEDKGLRVLSEGKFDFTSNEFKGTWRANNGVKGQYTDFKCRNVSKTFRPAGAMANAYNPQTLESMLEEDIPVVVAEEDVPLVDATVETPIQNEIAYEAAPVVQAVPDVPSVNTSYNQGGYVH